MLYTVKAEISYVEISYTTTDSEVAISYADTLAKFTDGGKPVKVSITLEEEGEF